METCWYICFDYEWKTGDMAIIGFMAWACFFILWKIKCFVALKCCAEPTFFKIHPLCVHHLRCCSHSIKLMGVHFNNFYRCWIFSISFSSKRKLFGVCLLVPRRKVRSRTKQPLILSLNWKISTHTHSHTHT